VSRPVFDAGALDRGYAFLDACPEHLLPEVVAAPFGTLSDRVSGALAWRTALLAGGLPAVDVWPPPEVAAPARAALSSMGLARFCEGEPELADAVLVDMLRAFVRSGEAFHADVLARLAELERLERRRIEEERARRAPRRSRSGAEAPEALAKLRAAWGATSRERAGAGGAVSVEGEGAAGPIVLDEATVERLRAQATRDAAAVQPAPDAELIGAWSERARAWTELAGVFGDLGAMLGRGWDLARGVLRHVGWKELLRLQELVKQLPELREVVRALGRLHLSDGELSVAEALFVPVLRLEEERREVPTPLVPAETRGVVRSGDIARMLPVEAVMLGHPQLRLLWHARRAEHALLSYRVEGMEIERVQVEREVQESQERQRPRPERGPILAVIDTSGSMHGLPEQVAKAIVLEAARTAHAEKRRCYLYAYSGPGDVLEHELDLGPEGIARLLVFLAHSFGGGTDIGAMSTVVARLRADDWKKADVILVSDGEWHAPAGVIAGVAQAKEDGTRFHGVQVGNRGQTGMHLLCDPVHVFQDWRAAGGWR
jgi:uncharacterized protein with von Willebrand factor type A (vWA) domain